MKIETKYNIGDEVYLRYDNQIKNGTVREIDMNIRRGPNELVILIHYDLVCGDKYLYGAEDEVYATKEELLKSL